MKKKLISMLLVCSMVLSMAACGSKEEAPAEAPAEEMEALAEKEAPAEAERNTTVLYTNTGPVEFFEVPWWNMGQYVHTKLLFETLIGMDENMGPTTESGMAESYELSEDGLTLTVNLRDGLKWHDGEEVTTDDVVWSIETTLIETVTAHTQLKEVMKSIAGAEEVIAGTADSLEGVTVDGNTITIQFAKVCPTAILGFSLLHILPKHCLENADMAMLQTDMFWQSPIGSGPFKVDEVKIGEYATFVPFEEYWGGAADFTVMSLASSAESDSNLVANVKAGQIDYAYTKAFSDVQALRDVEGVTIHDVSVNYTRWLMLNQYKKDENDVNPLADVRVRQAIAYAIDKALICEQVFEGATLPGDGTLIPTGSVWKSEGLESYDYDPEKAKALLEEAGWDSSRTLDMVYYYTDQQTIDLMAILQQMLAAVGINVKPRLIEGDLPAQLNAAPSSTDENGVSGVTWDIAYGALSATNPFDYYQRFGSTSTSNICTPATEEMDGYLDELISTADEAKQKEAFAKIEAYHAENMLYVPLYYQPVWVVTSDKIEGNVETWGNPQFSWNWDIQNWTLK